MPRYSVLVEVGTIYTVSEFKRDVENGCLVDYDGHGYPSRNGYMDVEIVIKPSRIGKIPADATHIVWYNK